MSYGFSPLAGFDSGSETGCHRADAALERKVCADTSSCADPSGLDGLIFTGGEETYVLAFFKAVRRLAVCGV